MNKVTTGVHNRFAVGLTDSRDIPNMGNIRSWLRLHRHFLNAIFMMPEGHPEC